MGLPAGEKEMMAVLAQGAGGLDEMKEHLKDDQMVFGGFRVDGVDKRGGVTSRRCKLVVFSWSGASVKPMLRARGRQHMTQVLKYFHGHHLKLEITDKDDLSGATPQQQPPRTHARATPALTIVVPSDPQRTTSSPTCAPRAARTSRSTSSSAPRAASATRRPRRPRPPPLPRRHRAARAAATARPTRS